MKIKKTVNIFWFRRDLRLNDNKGLFHALNAGLPVLPLFIFDENILKDIEVNDPRVEFIYQNVEKLNQELSKKGSGLLVLKGNPIDIFMQLTLEYEVANVYTNMDYEPYSLKRDTEIKELLYLKSTGFHHYHDHVIFAPGEILKADGRPYEIFTPFSKAWNSKLNSQALFHFKSESLLDRCLKESIQRLKSLSEIGFNSTKCVFPSSEIPEEKIRNYDKTRNFPAIDGTTYLGIHLRFGTISIRECVEIALKLNRTWLNELIWREFFIQILAHYPYVVNNPFKKRYQNIRWNNNENDFRKWCAGQTGYPLVDAGMRQLLKTGFMHNRVRMVCSSFLVKHLIIDWRLGEAWFANHLLDYELSSNNGNWQWIAGCGCDAAPYFRIFNPIRQQQLFDPKYEYIKKWIPDYSSVSYPKYIINHEEARIRCITIYKEALE